MWRISMANGWAIDDICDFAGGRPLLRIDGASSELATRGRAWLEAPLAGLLREDVEVSDMTNGWS